MLNERIEVYKRLKNNTNTLGEYIYKTEKQYKEEFPFLKEADSIALQSSREHLYHAFQKFFNGLNEGRNIGYPKFKSKKDKECYTTKQINKNIRIDFKRKVIKLPKLKWVKYKDKRFFSQKIKFATITKTKTNKYFLSFNFEAEVDVNEKQTIIERKISAFDMSAKHFLVNNIIKMENPRFYRIVEKKTRALHKKLSKKKKKSKNREKIRLKLACHYEKIYNRKKDWTHKITRKLVEHFDVIILEDLNLKYMQKFNSGLAKSISLDFSWSQFTSYLKYKMKWLGKHFLNVNRFFASSKICSHCGWKNNNLKLNERTWSCLKCGRVHDRDINASINLKNEGIRILLEEKNVTIIHDDDITVGTTGSHAFGENVRPTEILKNFYRQFLRNKEIQPLMVE